MRRRRGVHERNQRSGAPAGRGAAGLVAAEAPERRDQAQRLPRPGALHRARQGLGRAGAGLRGRSGAHGQPAGEQGHGGARRGLRDDRGDRHRSGEPRHPDGSRGREEVGRPRRNG